MKYIPLVRVNTFLPFITFLDRMGSPIERWLEAVKLSPFALEDPESLIPRHLVFEFAQKAAQAEGLENLGLLIGQDCSIANLGNFGQLICGSLTLYDALITLQKIAPANNTGWKSATGAKARFKQIRHGYVCSILGMRLFCVAMLPSLLGRCW